MFGFEFTIFGLVYKIRIQKLLLAQKSCMLTDIFLVCEDFRLDYLALSTHVHTSPYLLRLDVANLPLLAASRNRNVSSLVI